MKHNFEYLKTVSAMDSFLIDDISEFCIECNNDTADCYYLRVGSSLGECELFKFGPLNIDDNTLEKEFFIDKQIINYSEPKIISYVDKLINNPKLVITQIREIDNEEFEEKLKICTEQLGNWYDCRK